MQKNVINRSSITLASLSALSLQSSLALAAPGGVGLPWESTFTTVSESIQGLSTVFVTIAIVIAGFVLMFGESGGMSRRVVGIVVGGAAVFGASAMVGTLFEDSAGAMIEGYR